MCPPVYTKCDAYPAWQTVNENSEEKALPAKTG